MRTLPLAGLLALVTPAALLTIAAPAHADGPIDVDCSVASLVAGFDQLVGAGGGTIDLAPSCTYTFTAPDNSSDGGNALPVLQQLPNGATVNGNGAVLQRSSTSGTPPFRILRLGHDPRDATSVTINDLTIAGGVANGENVIFDSAFRPIFGDNATVGGGIEDLLAGALTLNHVTIADNTSVVMGGGMITAGLSAAPITITDSDFVGNTAGGWQSVGGGAVELWSAREVDVTGSAFVGNSSLKGAAIAVSEAFPSLTNDTITQNHATGGGIISVCCSTVSNLPLVNVTIAGNTSPGATALSDYAFAYARNSIIDGTCGLVGGTGPYSLGHNVLPNPGCTPMPVRPSNCPPAGCGPDITGVPSQLGALADNGGPTQTMAIGADSPGYRLVPAALCPTTDQRGAARPQPGTTACNAGAYETQALPTTLAYTGPASGTYGVPITVSAALSHPASAVGLSGTTVPGQPVTLAVGSQTCTATTDAAGTASCQITPSDPPSGTPYPVTLTFAGAPTGIGTDAYSPTTDTSATFTVTRVPTTLTALPQVTLTPWAPSAGLLHLAATLTSGDSPLAGKTIVFTVAATRLCTAVTTNAGLAKCAIGATAQAKLAAARRYTATYAGDTVYLPSAAGAPMIGLR